jgi:Fe-S cluster biogenesis protein NfuA
MEIKEKVIAVINEVKPALENDGGGIEFVDLIENDTVVLVNLTGACNGCPMSTMTIKGYVESTMIENIPQIKEVRLA